ncbi:MFS transporter [Kribbella endophytica]
MPRRRLFADLSPLRESVDFRWLWAGQSLSAIGNVMTMVAVSIQAYDVTGSSIAVGGLGLANLIPTLLLGLFGGSIADAVDRRRLVLLTSTGLMAVGILFAVQAFLHWNNLWLLYLLTATSAALAAVDGSARRTFPPRFLPVRLLPAAAALNQLSFQVAIIAAPLFAGVLIATVGIGAAYAVDAVTFLAALAGVRRLPPMPPVGGGATFGLRSVAEGIRYAARHPLIGMIFLLDLNATALAMPTALFPALADTHFGGGPQTVSYLFAAIGVGGIVAATLSGPLGHLRHQGRAMLISVALWGTAIGAVALTTHLWLGLICLAIAGAADIITTVFRATILQANTPDDLLGRVSSLDLMVGIGGPNLGNLRAGTLGGLLGPAPALLLGGLTCLLGAGILTASSKPFRQYDASRAEG